jgi:hypothetical protein
MELNVSQLFEIEQLLFKGKKNAAIKYCQQETACGPAEAENEIDRILRQLQEKKPWMFERQGQGSASGAEADSIQAQAVKVARIGKKAIIAFAVFDSILFAGLIYWFFIYQSENDGQQQKQRERLRQENITAVEVARETPVQKPPVQALLPKVITDKAVISASPGNNNLLAGLSVDPADFHAELDSTDTFVSLYEQKLADSRYIKRKSHSSLSRKHDDSLLEKKIKTLRRSLSAKRTMPAGMSALPVPVTKTSILVDGQITQAEWQQSLSIRVSEQFDTTLYFLSDGDWLYVACDARDELTADGFDQFRVYLHAGLIPELINERVHLGRGKGLTSIRQTDIFWQGAPPENDNERWKKYAISDWGLYKYATGKSAIHGNRHYELAINLAEAGLHKDIPFTLYAEIETDPLKNEKGKFVKRRYLGELASQQAPQWFVLKNLPL